MKLRVVLPLVALAASVAAQDRVPPAKGVFLVAKARIDGGPFHQSVVLLLAHGEDGTLGLMVNRPTGIPLSKALPDLDVGETTHELYLGGPVGVEGLLVLFRSETAPSGALRIMEDVYYSGERDVLERLLEEGRPSDEIRLFFGHSGWAPGQLDKELLEGAWDLVRADAFTVFRTEPERIWEHLREGGLSVAQGSSRGVPAGGGGLYCRAGGLDDATLHGNPGSRGGLGAGRRPGGTGSR